MSKELTLNQKSAILRVARVHPAVSFSVKKVTQDALVERGYFVEARVPLSPKVGAKLTAAGVEYAKTGRQIHHKG